MLNVTILDEIERRIEQAKSKVEQYEEMRMRAEAEAAALNSIRQEILRRAKQQEGENESQNAQGG